jgi:hypothetical protein
LSNAAKKLDDDFVADSVNEPTERELKLAKNFEDPGLDEVLSGLAANPEPIPLIEEAAEAMHELVHGAAAIDLGEEEVFEDLPIPDDAIAMPAPAESSAPRALPQTVNINPDPLEQSRLLEVPTSESSAPRALPQTVNMNPDPLDLSILMQVPQDSVEEAAGVFTFEGESEQTGQLSAMYSMSDSLFELVACELSFDEVVEKGLRAIMEGVSAHAGSVLELDHEHEDFFFRASLGGSPVEQLKAFRVPITKGIVGHVAESGQPLLIRDLAEDEMQMRAISLSVGFDAKTCMAAPILVGGQPYGVIEVFNRRDGGLFDERDLRSLEDGLRMFSKVLEVRFLLAELSRRAAR